MLIGYVRQHLVRAFEAGFEIGAKPIATGVVEAGLSSQLVELEPRLTRTATTCAAWPSSSTPSPPRYAGCCEATWMRVVRRN